MNARVAATALVVLGAIGALELGASAVVYRDQIDADDWDAAAEAIEQLPGEEPVFLAQPWLGPTGRMWIPQLREPSSVALPDLRGHRRLHTLGYQDVGARRLEALWDGGDRPRLLETQPVGDLVLATWSVSPERTLWNWTRDAPEMMDAGGRCRGTTSRKCPDGQVRLQFGEVDYAPRWAWWIDLEDATTIRLADDAVLGDRLRGHIGFSDFNARLRSDAPVNVTLRIDDEVRVAFLVSDEEGWRSFEVPTDPGPARIELQITTALRGTWSARGYSMPPTRKVGVELRALEASP